jgi:hypothetical protein
MTKSMKRIHKVTIKRMVDDIRDTVCEEHIEIKDENCAVCDREWNQQTGNYVGIRADAEVLIPLYEMHSASCTEINEKRAKYVCECSSKDSLIQHITSGGLWGVEASASGAYLAEIVEEQLSELSRVLHTLGFSKRAIAAAFKSVEFGK